MALLVYLLKMHLLIATSGGLPTSLREILVFYGQMYDEVSSFHPELSSDAYLPNLPPEMDLLRVTILTADRRIIYYRDISISALESQITVSTLMHRLPEGVYRYEGRFFVNHPSAEKKFKPDFEIDSSDRSILLYLIFIFEFNEFTEELFVYSFDEDPLARGGLLCFYLG